MTTTITSVLNRTEALCDALTQNFAKYSIKSHLRSALAAETLVDSAYHKRKAEEIESGKGDLYRFLIETGRKYHKIIMVDTSGSRSVHAFVDKNTGDVYKSASWKSPAKGVRFNLMNDASYSQVISTCDWAGSYLYLR